MLSKKYAIRKHLFLFFKGKSNRKVSTKFQTFAEYSQKFSTPGRSQGLLCKHSLSTPLFKLTLRRHQAKTVGNYVISYQIDYVEHIFDILSPEGLKNA